MRPIKKPQNQDDQESDNQSSVDSEDSDVKINTDNSPKIIPIAKLPQKLRNKKIVINVSDTQYPIVSQIAEQLGWIVQEEPGEGDWDLWWTDREIEPNTLYKMNLHQKINHFPGIYVLARKNLLGLHLMAMQKRFPIQYNFFPQTWIVPMQFPQFRQYYQNIQEGKVRTYIVKPEALSQGRGIFLTRSIEDILNGHKYVIQRYLKNPLLLDGLKFDLRLYVLLAGSEPLRLYIYDEGLVRLATRTYQAPTSQNLKQNYIHLTNYSLNKNNPDYVYNKSDKQMDVGHKRSLKSVYQKLSREGVNIDKLKGQIEECIIKTVISGLPSIRHQYKYCQPQQYQGNMCFHILGFDVMILDDLKPIVLEVNHTPSFETATPLDYQIKKNLIMDTLDLMRINSKEKKSLFSKAKDLTKKRIQTGKRDIMKGQKRQEELQRVQKLRDHQQQKILFSESKKNGYKRIFPFQDVQKNQMYGKFIQAAEQVMKEQKDNRKKIISDQIKNQNRNPNKNQRSSQKNKSIKTSNKLSGFRQNSNERNKYTYKKPNQNYKPKQEQGNSESDGSNKSCHSQTKVFKSDKVIEIDSAHYMQQGNFTNKKTCQLKARDKVQKKTVYSSKAGQNQVKGSFHIRSNQKNLMHKHSLPLGDSEKDNEPQSPILLEKRSSSGSNTIKISQSEYQKIKQQYVSQKDPSYFLQSQTNNQILQEENIIDSHIISSRNLKTAYNHKADLVQQNTKNIDLLAELKKTYDYEKQIQIRESIGKGKLKSSLGKNTNQVKNCKKVYDKQKFHDLHMLRKHNNPHHTEKILKNSPLLQKQVKKLEIQSFFCGLQNKSGLIASPVLLKDQRNPKTEMKVGKFIKPKTYNLHENKFPQQQKYIVRTNPSIYAESPFFNFVREPSYNLKGMLKNIQQYDQESYKKQITTHTPQHGYSAKSKVNHNKNISSVNSGTKPAPTSNKNKSISVAYKQVPFNNTKNNPTLMKHVQKSRNKDT